MSAQARPLLAGLIVLPASTPLLHILQLFYRQRPGPRGLATMGDTRPLAARAPLPSAGVSCEAVRTSMGRGYYPGTAPHDALRNPCRSRYWYCWRFLSKEAGHDRL